MNMFFYFIVLFIYLTHGHLLPEDSLTDNEEQLNREKRDNFLDSILKTIPFFNPTAAEQQEEEEPVDPNDDYVIITPLLTSLSTSPSTPIVSMTTTTANTSSSILATSAGITLSATIVPSPTLFSSLISSNISVLQTSTFKSVFTVSSSSYNRSSSIRITPRLAISSTSLSMTSVPSSTFRVNVSRSTLMTVIESETSHTKLPSLTYPSVKSVAKLFASASKVTSSISMSASTTSPAREASETIISMVIMPAEAGLLPNEKGYGDQLDLDVRSDKDMKNIKFIYRNVLIPIMSGIFGALLITFGIIIYKCVRRRKLQKMRYYGGKSTAGLYRLDHMSLLSDDSSDED